MEDMNFLHFCIVECGQPCLNSAECDQSSVHIPGLGEPLRLLRPQYVDFNGGDDRAPAGAIMSY